MAAVGSVRAFAAHSGLDRYDGFSTYLESLASTRVDLAYLTDADWLQVLAPLDLKLGKARRVEYCIDELRSAHASKAHAQQQEQAEMRSLRGMLESNGTKPRTDQAEFVPSHAFVGGRPGFVFRSGARGLGYYHDQGSPAPAQHSEVPPQQRRYVQEQEQAILQQRQRRLHEQQQQQRQQQAQQRRTPRTPSPRTQARAASMARLSASPFATDPNA